MTTTGGEGSGVAISTSVLLGALTGVWSMVVLVVPIMGSVMTAVAWRAFSVSS